MRYPLLMRSDSEPERYLCNIARVKASREHAVSGMILSLILSMDNFEYHDKNRPNHFLTS